MILNATLLAVAAHWLGQRDTTRVTDPWPPRQIAALQADLPVVRQAVRARVECGRAEQAADLLLSRRRAFVVLERQDEVFAQLRELINGGLNPPWLARAQVIAGGAAYNMLHGDAPELLGHVDDLDRADDVFRVFGYCYQAVSLAEAGNTQAAEEAIDRAIVRADRAQDGPRLMLMAHSAASWVASERGDVAGAVTHAEAGVRAARNSDEVELLVAIIDLARAELRGDDAGAARAVKLMEDAFQRARRIGVTRWLAEVAHLLGVGLIRLGHVIDGSVLVDDALRTIGHASDQSWMLDLIATIAVAALQEGEVAAGAALLAEARAQVRALSDHPANLEVNLMAFPGFVLDPADSLPIATPDLSELAADAHGLAAGCRLHRLPMTSPPGTDTGVVLPSGASCGLTRVITAFHPPISRARSCVWPARIGGYESCGCLTL
ncbi:MAG: hypothetical protein ACR2F6_07555 [Mycobacteriales bacterium]